MKLRLCAETALQEKGMMSHFRFENDGKCPVKTWVIFGSLFIIITFLTAAFHNRAIKRWILHLVKMNANMFMIERVAILGLIILATLGITLSIFPFGILYILINFIYFIMANSTQRRISNFSRGGHNMHLILYKWITLITPFLIYIHLIYVKNNYICIKKGKYDNYIHSIITYCSCF